VYDAPVADPLQHHGNPRHTAAPEDRGSKAKASHLVWSTFRMPTNSRSDRGTATALWPGFDASGVVT